MLERGMCYEFLLNLAASTVELKVCSSSMGDSETLVAETSAVMGYSSAGYANSSYADASTNTVPDAGAYTVPTAGSGLGNGNACNMDPNSVTQQVAAAGTAATSDNITGLQIPRMSPAQAVDYSSLNGNVNEAGNVTSFENESSLGIGSGAVSGREVVDGSGMSLLCTLKQNFRLFLI